MKFAPKTEREIAEAGLWQPGVYDFEITAAEETTSKAGNDMIKLRVRVVNDQDQWISMDDYLVDTERAAFKIRHCAEACGLIASYERGELNADDMIGRTGRCKIAIAKDKNGQYPDKNSIADYVKGSIDAPAPQRRQPAPVGGSSWEPPKGGDIDDDSIPF